MTTIPVSSTGRITIPAAMRRKLGWGKGTLVDVYVEGDEAILRPAKEMRIAKDLRERQKHNHG